MGQIDAVSGEIVATSHPTQPMYHVTVHVSDGGVPAMTSEVDVVIVVEPVLALTNVPDDVTVEEDAAVGEEVFRVEACCCFTAVKVALSLYLN